MGKKNPKVDFYFKKSKKFQKEILKLREILLETELEEQLKWGVPCYTLNDKNIILIHEFKEYCAICFFQGALLNDPYGLLIQQTKNVQAARQIRFADMETIIDLESTLKEYIQEAIKNEKVGMKIVKRKTEDYPVPEEFQKKLEERPDLKTAFESLTPGRQRGYLLYFAAAKQSKTRLSRIEKYIQPILDGKGVDD